MEKETNKKPELTFPMFFVHKAYKHYIRIDNLCDGMMLKMYDRISGSPVSKAWRNYEYSLKSLEPEGIQEIIDGCESYIATTGGSWNHAIESFKEWSNKNFQTLYKKAI